MGAEHLFTVTEIEKAFDKWCGPGFDLEILSDAWHDFAMILIQIAVDAERDKQRVEQ
jgi:hypothetical protein